MTKAVQFLKANGCDPATMNGLSFRWRDPSGHIDRPSWALLRDAHMKHALLRDAYIHQFGFAVLTQAMVEIIRPMSPIIEIGAGCGYWAYELRRAKIDVIATDSGIGTYEGITGGRWQKTWTTVEHQEAVAAATCYPLRTLLVVWPDYSRPWAADAIDAYQGSTVIYVGEGNGGCTGDDRFHQLLDQRFTREARYEIPQFDGLHDRLEIWHKQEKM